MKNTKIRTKLIVLTSAMIIIIFTLGFFFIQSSHNATSDMKDMYNNSLTSIEIGSDLRTQTRANKCNLLDLIISKDEKKKVEINADIEKRNKTINEDMDKLNTLSSDKKQKELYGIVKSNLDSYREVFLTSVDMARANNTNEAYDVYTKNSKLLETYQSSVRDINDYNSKDAKDIYNSYKSNAENTERVILFLVVMAIIIGIALGSYIIKGIKKSISNLSLTLDALKKGDFTVEISENTRTAKDEIGIMAMDVSLMQDSLKKLVETVKNEAINVTINVEDSFTNINSMNSNIEDVSASTEELSAGMEETAASAEEMTATAQEIERAVESIAKHSQNGAIKVIEISKRAVYTKQSVNDAQIKATEVFDKTKAELEKAIESSKIVDEISVLSEAIMLIDWFEKLFAL